MVLVQSMHCLNLQDTKVSSIWYYIHFLLLSDYVDYGFRIAWSKINAKGKGYVWCSTH